MNEPTPAQIFEYDQARAARTDELAALILATGETLQTHRRETTIGGLATYLHEQTSHEACAELLALALERMADMAVGAEPKTAHR